MNAILSPVVVAMIVLTAVISAQASHGTGSILLDAVTKASNRSLLWGPYRPNLYFGVKPRIPDSFSAGLLWANVDEYQGLQNKLRYACEQGDNMDGYGWEYYDVRTGGHQVIRDQENKIDIETTFVKVESGEHGGHWGVRVKGTPRENAPSDLKTTVVLQLGVESLQRLKPVNSPDIRGQEGDIQFQGTLPQLGDFVIDITKGVNNTVPPKAHAAAWAERPLDRTIVASLEVDPSDVWQAKAIFLQELQQSVQRLSAKFRTDDHPPPWQTFVLDNNPEPGNIHFVQKVFEGGFQFDILYKSASGSSPITPDVLTEKALQNKMDFLAKFRTIFAGRAPFDSEKYQAFAQNLFSTLLSGIGYFHGTSIVDRTYAEEYSEENEGFWEEASAAQKRPGAAREEGPTELFTSVPSRPFFPRGFYWDEGFHLMPILEWDTDLALNIVKSWFSLIDADGWVAREQILGKEARSKVPAEFQVQYPHYANPPTLFLILDRFINILERTNTTGAGKTRFLEQKPLGSIGLSDLPLAHQNPSIAQKYLRDIYPSLRRHYHWFRESQKGEVRAWDRTAFSSKEAYRWRGRTPNHCLTSGLDDYPRSQPPHTGELHVDLISWVGGMTRSMKRIAAAIGEAEDAAEYQRIEDAVLRNIDDLHWSDKSQTYCDATIDDFEESVHICHKGYISLFPVLLGLVDHKSPKLGKVLDLIEDPEELWSDYGLRSLSKADKYYGTEENYWRGPIWVNLNYLAIIRLAEYGAQDGPHRGQAARLYEKLRKNVVDTVYREWERTGYAWEQYDPTTGRGQRTAHFLGWTSLVVNIMGMPEKVGQPLRVQSKVKDEL